MPGGMIVVQGRLSLHRRLHLAWRVWRWFIVVQFRLRRQQPLPRLVEDLRRSSFTSPYTIPPLRLGRTIHKTLSVGGYRPRCLVTSLVFLRLLIEQQEPAVLVIGLPKQALNHDAHAWIELKGADVGPPPGRLGHMELARYEPPAH